jgi:L-fucose mutarotase/ribose pyranase (RbsD/FucU family)
MSHPFMVTKEGRTANHVTGKFFSRILILTRYPAREAESSVIVNDVNLLSTVIAVYASCFNIQNCVNRLIYVMDTADSDNRAQLHTDRLCNGHCRQ